MNRKAIIRRISKACKSGTSKAGNPYTLDFTEVTIELPMNTADAVGFKEVNYRYGDHTNFDRLLPQLSGRLPLECGLIMDIEFDQYGKEVTVIKDVILPKA